MPIQPRQPMRPPIVPAAPPPSLPGPPAPVVSQQAAPLPPPAPEAGWQEQANSTLAAAKARLAVLMPEVERLQRVIAALS